jgi:hypothetical protein
MRSDRSLCERALFVTHASAHRLLLLTYRLPRGSEWPLRTANAEPVVWGQSHWRTRMELPVDLNVLRIAATDMRSDLGTLDDLPPALGNTLANIYYRFFAYQQHMATGGRSILLDPYIRPSPGNRVDSFRDLNEFSAETISAYKFAPETVKTVIRRFRETHPQSHEALITIFLDQYKFRISRTPEKSALRRWCERQFKTPREIPNLLLMMEQAGLLGHTSDAAVGTDDASK